MKVVYPSAKKFANVMSALSNFFDELAIVFDEEGMKFKSMDVSRVLLVSMKIPKSEFEVYDVEGREVVGVSMDVFAKVLKRAGPKDSIGMEFDGSVLTVSFIGKSKRVFRLGVIDVDEMELDIPELPYTAMVEVDSKVFSEVVSDAKVVSPDGSIKMKITKNGELIMSSESEVSEYSFTLSPMDEALLDYKVDDDGYGLYGLAYLKDLAKLVKVAPKMKIKLGNELPLHINVNDGSSEIEVLLAPRLEE